MKKLIMKQLKLVAVLVYLVCPSIFGQNIDNEDSKPSSADYYAKINERYGDLRISLEKRLAEIRGRNFNITNVPHQLSNGLPCSKQQLVLISTPQATWLQLENYEFLLNSKESNKLITAYIGIVNGQKITLDLVQQQTQDQQKRIIAILDPESVYVFQNAIVSYWNQAGASDLNLEEAIARGFTALAYHFGATNQLPYEPIISSKKIATYSELCKQIDMHLDKYQQHQKQLSRQISTLEELQTREKSGFIAYYPNPIYLGEMAWYIRPHDMKYFEYAQLSQLESSAETTYSSHLPYQPKILTNANQDDTAARQQCQQFIREGYTVPISNTTKHLPYIRETSTSLHDYKAEDFNCISGYTFRSDGRTLEKISDDDGFWSSVLFGNYDHMYSTKTNSDILKTYPELKRLKHYASHSLPATHTMATPYIATSASIGVAKHFDDNVYLILIHGGVDVPSFLDNENINYLSQNEIAVPSHVAWSDVLGVRSNKRGSNELNIARDTGILFNPVFLRQSLSQEDPENFWQILQTFGGKPQCSNLDRRAALISKYYQDLILQQQSHEAINWGPYIELFGFTPKMAQTIATVWYEDDQMHKLFDELITATMGLPKTIDRTSAAIKVETPIKQY